MAKLTPRRVLVVEDDYYIAADLAAALRTLGAEVVGPVPDRVAANRLLENEVVNAAVLDIKLGGDTVYPLATELQTRGIQFVFATGYGDTIIPAQFRGVPCFEKPMRPTDLARAVLSGPAASPGVDVNANLLLSRMPEEEFDRLRPHFTCVELRRGAAPFDAGDKLDHLLFPLSGVCSLSFGAGAPELSTALVGHEGMIGASLLMGVSRLPMRCTVQVDGEALSIAAEQFLPRLRSSPRAWTLLLRYQHVLHMQTAYALLSAGAASIEQRVARLLLMLADRVGDEISIIHDAMSTMLHVRRAGVTQALHILEGEGGVRARRGKITIRDRSRVEQAAGLGYGLVEAEYERLLGVSPRLPGIEPSMTKPSLRGMFQTGLPN
ncbi:hypothetical protein SLNSH_02620 [Alsobacter soli]|uniref:Response regulatory domain-containing protein n=1 Tax=Alsobacter soli TaxID=2109933 RepID=A0A2T1HYQ1_9HYPH|nr:helix-turn-helix domain-containing protein [Alsobacter soli]PSC06708.1 hypothetical protein SLNSH_02620 [Alsobacter soli]